MLATSFPAGNVSYWKGYTLPLTRIHKRTSRTSPRCKTSHERRLMLPPVLPVITAVSIDTRWAKHSQCHYRILRAPDTRICLYIIHAHTTGGDIWAHPAGDHRQVCWRGHRLLWRQARPAGGLRIRAGFGHPREVAGGTGFRRRLRQRLRVPLVSENAIPRRDKLL